MKKEFDYAFAELGDFMTASWTAKKLIFVKSHSKEIEEELRLENLTDKPLKITITQHKLLKHPRTIVLKQKQVKHIKLKIPCGKIKGKHSSYLILKSANQIEKIPIRITHKD